MPKIDESVINFACYEDGKEYCGLAKVTLPDLNYLTQSISGAGIAGNVDAVILGHMDAMSTTIDFRTYTDHAARLAEPRRHQIDLRVAQQQEDTTGGKIIVQKIKHIMVVVPKSTKGGSIAPASPSDASGEYSVRYWATYIDNKKVVEVDPLNFKCIINGVDYLKDVSKALGK